MKNKYIIDDLLLIFSEYFFSQNNTISFKIVSFELFFIIFEPLLLHGFNVLT